MNYNGGIGNRPLFNIYQSFKNVVLNAIGVDRDLEKLLDDGDVDKALSLFNDREDYVKKALSEYYPQLHEKVHLRPDKIRDGKDPYIAEKLPRAIQRDINEKELFFLYGLGDPITFRNDTIVPDSEINANDEAYNAFLYVMKTTRFYTNMKEAKRMAGALTESAKIYRTYRDEITGEAKIGCNLICKIEGHDILTLFDKYGTLSAFAYKYEEKIGTKNKVDQTQTHVDIQTSRFIYECIKEKGGWNVLKLPNLTGKINAIYYEQETAWNGSQERIERLELIDSQIADTNRYSSDPILLVATGNLKSLPSPDTPGRVMFLEGEDITAKNTVSYLEAPSASALLKMERDNLEQTICIDTGTPAMDFKALAELGDLSGVAIRRIMIPGLVKRNRLREKYDELLDREINLVLSIMANVTHIRYAEQLRKMDISYTYGEPFPETPEQHAKDIAEIYSKGVISLESAIQEVNLYDDYELEVERLKGNNNAAENDTIQQVS